MAQAGGTGWLLATGWCGVSGGRARDGDRDNGMVMLVDCGVSSAWACAIVLLGTRGNG